MPVRHSNRPGDEFFEIGAYFVIGMFPDMTVIGFRKMYMVFSDICTRYSISWSLLFLEHFCIYLGFLNLSIGSCV